jgi:4-amino-4-deoxy-L-arabinose transferase-like glycosyltransferase
MPFRRSLLKNSWAVRHQGWSNATLAQAPIDSFRGVMVLACLFGVIWVWHLMSVALTAPMDNIEQLVWSHSLEWGYHKHPPLPTWLLALPAHLSGFSTLTSAVLGATCTLLSALIFWSLIRQIWGRPSAYIALLAGLCITFYNGRLNYYNHNTVLMLSVSLSAHCWWMILTTGRTRWWIGLGAAAGLGMLSKYQYLLVLAPSAILIWQLKPWRNRQHLQGLGWAVLTACVIFTPHLLWLLQQNLADSPIRYALKTSKPAFLQGGVNLSHRLHSGLWLMGLVLNRCLPALLLLLGLKALSEPEHSEAPTTQSQISGNHFLWLWGALPPLCITLLGLLAGMDLQMQWGTAYAIWIVPPLMMLLGLHQRWICAPLTWLALGLFVLIQSLLLLQSYHTSFYGCCAGTAPHRWRLFDSRTLAEELDASAREAIGGTFKIIVGPTTAAGAVALALPDKPKVLIDHNLRISPWIHPQELHFAGVVELWPPHTGPDDRTILPSGWGWRLYAEPQESLWSKTKTQIKS